MGGARELLAAVVAAASVACVAESQPEPEPVELAELCGSAEPIRLLQFEPWRQVAAAWQLAEIGERRLLIMRYADTHFGNNVLWAVGPCGEAPRQLGSEGPFGLWTPPGYDDAALLCDPHTGQVRALDVLGERPASPLFEFSAEQGCFVRQTDVGVFVIRPDISESPTGSLLLYPWPEDPFAGLVEPSVVVDEVKTHYASIEDSRWHALVGDDHLLYFATVANELVRMRADDGTSEIIATDVFDFRVGYEVDEDSQLGFATRYVLWQHLDPDNPDLESPVGELVMLDTATGEETALGDGALWATSHHPLSWARSKVMVVPGTSEDAPLRIYDLDTMDPIEVPPTLELLEVLADERHFVVREQEEGPIALLDIQTGEIEPLPGNPVTRYWSQQRVLALLPKLGPPPDLGQSELWLLDGGGPPELVARRVTYAHSFMPDGRVLTGVELDQEGVGDLLVVEPSTLEERLVATGVHAQSAAALGRDADDTTLTYSIPAGEDAGLWLVRLPPRE